MVEQYLKFTKKGLPVVSLDTITDFMVDFFSDNTMVGQQLEERMKKENPNLYAFAQSMGEHKGGENKRCVVCTAVLMYSMMNKEGEYSDPEDN